VQLGVLHGTQGVDDLGFSDGHGDGLRGFLLSG